VWASVLLLLWVWVRASVLLLHVRARVLLGVWAKLLLCRCSCCSLLPARLLLLMALNSSTLALGCMDLLRV